MGRREIKLDHQLTYELWFDDFFWENAPAWESYREAAEQEVMRAFENKSSLLLRNSKLYNEWKQDILARAVTAPADVSQITSFIQSRRKRTDESIVVRDSASKAKVVLTNGTP